VQRVSKDEQMFARKFSHELGIGLRTLGDRSRVWHVGCLRGVLVKDAKSGKRDGITLQVSSSLHVQQVCVPDPTDERSLSDVDSLAIRQYCDVEASVRVRVLRLHLSRQAYSPRSSSLTFECARERSGYTPTTATNKN
jgi:hypothetical protein